LTPGFKKLFLKSPALFFSPLQMLVDQKLKKEADSILKGINSSLNVETLRGSLPCYLRFVQEMRFGTLAESGTLEGQLSSLSSQQCREEFGLSLQNNRLSVSNSTKFLNLMALDFISQMSLNTVQVKVDGVLTFDTTTVAAKTDTIVFDDVSGCGGADESCFWNDTKANDGKRTGTLIGSYLTGGQLEIEEAKNAGFGISDVEAISAGSSDQALKFSFKLKGPIQSQKQIHFKVKKPSPDDPTITIDSLARTYLVSYSLDKPTISKAEIKDKTLTVTGAGFYKMPGQLFSIRVTRPGRTDEETFDATSANANTMTITLNEVQSGCWTVSVAAAGFPQSDITTFSYLPEPKITEAKREGDKIKITGTNLIDTTVCGGPPITFQVVKGSESPRPTKGLKLDGTSATIDLEEPVKTGSWTVKLLVNGVEKGSLALTGGGQ
jgi:hypothetical protein